MARNSLRKLYIFYEGSLRLRIVLHPSFYSGAVNFHNILNILWHIAGLRRGSMEFALWQVASNVWESAWTGRKAFAHPTCKSRGKANYVWLSPTLLQCLLVTSLARPAGNISWHAGSSLYLTVNGKNNAYCNRGHGTGHLANHISNCPAERCEGISPKPFG